MVPRPLPTLCLRVDSTRPKYAYCRCGRAARPDPFWAPLGDPGLAKGAPVKKRPLAGGETYSGNAAGDFVAAAPFAFCAAPAD